MLEHSCCRVCEGSLTQLLSLGSLYVSDFIVPGETDGIRAPLDLMLCSKCSLVQLRHTVAADSMYRKYWYRSGTNRTMSEALADIAEKAEELIHLSSGDATLDIGCNDGTLLAGYKTKGTYRIGFDPAENLAPLSRQIANHVVVGYFDAEAFRSDPTLAEFRPKVITSIAMFYDLEDPRRFVSDIKAILHPEGLWVVQMSYLPLMLKQNELGNICHEHLGYYSLRSFEYLLDLYDFEVVDMEINDVNGGSFRIYIRNRRSDPSGFGDRTYRNMAGERVRKFREEELKAGLEDTQTYAEFAYRIERIRADVFGFVTEQVGRDKRVYVYGASTKGNTMLQYSGLDNTLIGAAADRNPDKWGRLTVGTHIPIISEEEARADRPDFFLVLPWHFLEGFKEREKAYLLSGGRFIVPNPHFALV